ncbi:MAG: hypothetical protein J7641_05825 [Cyanobacteria bacterium SID2]|nr:hypothetical protein [Cyanobacteria bacterium SID2]MBP0002895.1 hypothetical protein [Cyanobacteria bacterium SBC]
MKFKIMKFYTLALRRPLDRTPPPPRSISPLSHPPQSFRKSAQILELKEVCSFHPI